VNEIVKDGTVVRMTEIFGEGEEEEAAMKLEQEAKDLRHAEKLVRRQEAFELRKAKAEALEAAEVEAATGDDGTTSAAAKDEITREEGECLL
jgi:hypothetical protein